jgi:hypothetical protein
MKTAIIQSNYIPWRGYFDIIHDVDLFLFHDDIQYTKQDWRNRNFIKLSDGRRLLLTVPIGQAYASGNIDQVRISDDKWQKKHLNAIMSNYAKAEYFNEILPLLQDFYVRHKWVLLSEMNQYMIREICRFLNIRTRFMNVSELAVSGHKTERLIQILKKVGATVYLSGPSAQDYIDKNMFNNAGIELQYKDYSHYPEYHQFAQPFDGRVSIIDLLMHRGKDAPSKIWNHAS